ncbi:MAG: ATP-binding protein [Bacteroidetes bacterium]|nr:ATP-binding protein [Bacteroidota bacterium]
MAAYLITRRTLLENLDYSLRNEVRWVNEFIEPKAKRIRLKRAAIRELEALRKAQTKESLAKADSLERERVETDEIWNQIYQHTLMSPRRHYIQILDRNGDVLFRSQNLHDNTLQYPDIPYQWVNIVTVEGFNGETLRMALMQTDYVKIFVAYPLTPVYEVLDDFFYNAMLIAPFALLISVIGGWFLASKSLKPVDELTKAAREITAQNLSRRLPVYDVDDEIGRLTAQFNDMIERLEASFNQVQQFSADASHELKTPLTIMRGEIEVALRNKRISSSTRELLQSLYDEVVRLSGIVESLMTLIKSDNGRLTLSIGKVNIESLLHELVEEAKTLASSKKIKVLYTVTSKPTVDGDNAKLKQLFLNILDNAIKYTPNGGTILVSVDEEKGYAIVRVTDNGIGIPEKDKEKIFERFYRAKTRKRGHDPEGSGLGLAIAKWIVEAHKGTIEVQSQEGKGSTFTVKLPCSL